MSDWVPDNVIIFKKKDLQTFELKYENEKKSFKI